MTVSIVVGARSCPRSTRPTSSSTIVAARLTSASSPSRVRTFPRRKTLAAEPVLELAENGVLRARELGRDVVVEGQLAAGQRYAASFSRTAALTRLPSARPATFGITAPITLPIAAWSEAPLAAIASSTSRSSSSSESSAGR